MVVLAEGSGSKMLVIDRNQNDGRVYSIDCENDDVRPVICGGSFREALLHIRKAAKEL